MIDHAEAQAMRNMWIAAMSTHALDQVMDLVKAKRRSAEEFEAETARARRYLNSADFREVCSLAGVEFQPGPALANMLNMADQIVKQGGVGRNWVRAILKEVEAANQEGRA